MFTTWLINILISLLLSALFAVISMLIAPPQKPQKPAIPDPGTQNPPAAKEGIPIPHMRGTRWMSVNCLYWKPEGSSPIIFTQKVKGGKK